MLSTLIPRVRAALVILMVTQPTSASVTITFYVFFHASAAHRDLHSFPTRRSSDLAGRVPRERVGPPLRRDGQGALARDEACIDRKSTRLNSSHLGISYAVFCLKKKKKKQ